MGQDLQYGFMADHLKIMNSRMVLLNPKFVPKAEPGKDEEQK